MEDHRRVEKKRCGNPHDSKCISRKRQRSKLSLKIERTSPTSTESSNGIIQGHESEKQSKKNPCAQTPYDLSGRLTSKAGDPHSEHYSNMESYTVDAKRLLSTSSINDQQDTSCQTKSFEDTTKTLSEKQTLPFLSIEVGEPLPLVTSTENFPGPTRDFQPLTSPFEHVTLSSLHQFPFSLPPTPSLFPELPLEDIARSSNKLLSLSAVGRLIAPNPFAHHKLAQKIMHSPPMSPFSFPFVTPFRHINSPLLSDTHAFLRSSQLPAFKSLRETLSTSNRILLPPGIVTRGNHAGFIPNQDLLVRGTIDDDDALNGTRQNSNIPNPESLAVHRSLHPLFGVKSLGAGIPQCLSISLALPEDKRKLSSLQVLLRQQIEVFSANEDDVLTYARGRNKPITLNQVGIRCIHCANLSLNNRKKGSVYFPFTLLGIYQAAQNMASTHFIQDNCNEFPPETKSNIVRRMGCKSTAGSGREFWADAAHSLGLLDTKRGIRFIRDVVPDNEIMHQELFFRYC